MSYKDNFEFRIDIPYQYDNDDIVRISSGGIRMYGWENKFYKPFKDKIKKYLVTKQKRRCGFCRIRLSRGTQYGTLEHIVGKDEYPDFTFNSLNLVYCCQVCNTAKSVKNTLVNANVVQLPTNSNDYSIINPYYDDYLQHIDFIDDIIIKVKNNSVKGKNTIDFYELDRMSLAEDRAFEMNISFDEAVDILTLRVTKYNDPEILQRIIEIIDDMEDWEL
ncbi:MAG: hypothetical protein J0M18_00040 [Ignavibacteria bacterium]|nr:hypothetical protein [Ignavibacteria bacterium]